MAINLATKYSSKIAEKFTHASIVAGKCSTEWEFSGVKTVKIYTPQTVAPTDYTRSGTSRYGNPTDMGDTVQELTMTQDKSFSLVIDKGNNNEQMLIKRAGHMMQLQTNEQIVPMTDKYSLGVFSKKAGKIVASATALSKSNIYSFICDAEEYMTEKSVPEVNRYLYITGKAYNLLRQSDELIKYNESINKKAIEKGVVGEICNFQVVKVPTSYMPAGVEFIACYKNAVLLPYKIKEAKIHQDPPGISGALLEGRYNYDAFVIGQRADGVYVHAYTGAGGTSVATAPAIAINDGEATIEAAGASAIYYTVDGSDPRYSDTAEKYAEAFEVADGVTVKAYATVDGGLPSDVTEKTN